MTDSSQTPIQYSQVMSTPNMYGSVPQYGMGFSTGSEGPTAGNPFPVDTQSMRVSIYDEPRNMISSAIFPMRKIQRSEGSFTHVDFLSTNIDSNRYQFLASDHTNPKTIKFEGYRGHFEVESHSVAAIIPMLTLSNSAWGDEYPELRDLAMKRLRSTLALKRELAASQEIFNEDNYNTGFKTSSSNWKSDGTNIIDEINQALALPYPGGCRPNTIVLGKNVETHLLSNRSVIESSLGVTGNKTFGFANLPEFFRRMHVPLNVLTFENYTMSDTRVATYMGTADAALIYVGDSMSRVMMQGPEGAKIPTAPFMMRNSPDYSATFGFTAMYREPEAFEIRQMIPGRAGGNVYLQARETYQIVVTNIDANSSKNVKKMYNNLGFHFKNAATV